MAPTARGGGSALRGELCLRIEGAFSAAQLCELADRWRLLRDPRWDRSASDAARGLLREAERTFGLLELVRRLEIERPLYEWPDLSSEALAEWGPPSATPRPAVVSNEDATMVDAAPPSGLGSAAAPTEPGAPLDAPPASARAAAPLSAPAPPPSEPMRLFTATPASRTQGVDGRVLLAVAAMMLVVVVVAFGAGLLWSRRADRVADPRATPATNARSPAGVASQLLSDALAEVADRCDMLVDGPPTKDVLAAVQTDCGSAGDSHRRDTRSSDDTNNGDASTSQPLSKRPTDQRDPVDMPPPGPRLQPVRSSCVTRCRSDHAGCVSGCGAEPSDANQYGSWQGCTSRCLASESRCRLACR